MFQDGAEGESLLNEKPIIWKLATSYRICLRSYNTERVADNFFTDQSWGVYTVLSRLSRVMHNAFWSQASSMLLQEFTSNLLKQHCKCHHRSCFDFGCDNTIDMCTEYGFSCCQTGLFFFSSWNGIANRSRHSFKAFVFWRDTSALSAPGKQSL